MRTSPLTAIAYVLLLLVVSALWKLGYTDATIAGVLVLTLAPIIIVLSAAYSTARQSRGGRGD